MDKASKHGNRLLTAISEDSLTSKTSTYGCPVCRKAHILDLDRLQVRVSRSHRESLVKLEPFPSGLANDRLLLCICLGGI